MSPSLVIACLSQKGGVGKSTIARLTARTYAAGDWNVKIADFNTKQTTSLDWVAKRLNTGWKPDIAAEPFDNIKTALKSDVDLLVIDGRPDSDKSNLEIAKESNVILVPTGVSADDLKPQVAFGMELVARGIPRHKILFIINRSNDSQVAVSDAQAYIQMALFPCAKTDLRDQVGYQIAQNMGRAVSETLYHTLNTRAEQLAQEIAEFANQAEKRAVA